METVSEFLHNKCCITVNTKQLVLSPCRQPQPLVNMSGITESMMQESDLLVHIDVSNKALLLTVSSYTTLHFLYDALKLHFFYLRSLHVNPFFSFTTYPASIHQSRILSTNHIAVLLNNSWIC